MIFNPTQNEAFYHVPLTEIEAVVGTASKAVNKAISQYSGSETDVSDLVGNIESCFGYPLYEVEAKLNEDGTLVDFDGLTKAPVAKELHGRELECFYYDDGLLALRFCSGFVFVTKMS